MVVKKYEHKKEESNILARKIAINYEYVYNNSFCIPKYVKCIQYNKQMPCTLINYPYFFYCVYGEWFNYETVFTDIFLLTLNKVGQLSVPDMLTQYLFG